METCHVPLLDHWRAPVIEAFSELGWIVHVEGYNMGALGVKLGDDHVETCISALITTRTLTLTP